jgi:hypothetical protein
MDGRGEEEEEWLKTREHLFVLPRIIGSAATAG